MAATELWGMKEGVLDALMEDIDTADVDEKLKPGLYYVKKLTLTPGRMTQKDADDVFAAGWDDGALLEAANICALFCMMNRVAYGAGVRAENTQTTLAKVKWPSYTENLINYGFEMPPEA